MDDKRVAEVKSRWDGDNCNQSQYYDIQGFGDIGVLLDALTTAQARIAELEALVEWRTDWENAPKDGDVWLLGAESDDGDWFKMAWSPNGEERWVDDLDGLRLPTHYRLITPPTADEAKERP